jgi:hypothetical protein
MKIDLCKIFGVEEGEEFKFDKLMDNYKIKNNVLYITRDVCGVEFKKSSLAINEAMKLEVVKLPKKKEFTDDELAIMRSLPKEYEWIARDKATDIVRTFANKPKKSEYETWVSEGYCCFFSIFNHLFNSIQWEDEEPVFIDDYVERGAE